ncbi:hypothetical protein G5714_024548 [Onychostoma macrolepis]|uniref:Uncharacterized protein n=1 Tax=Onychostoma macrolepis TaxID=369639 RepID=A0A7J6BIP5_9TELE|nr:hypothetical protein G5714_024548 [Onychostoma macrolepis]
MKAKLRGLFRATPGPETRLPGRVGTTPVPLGPVVGAFSSDARPRDTSPWRGGHYPSAPWIGLSVPVKAKLQGLFERCQAKRHVSLAGGHYPSAPYSALSVTVKAKLRGFSSDAMPRDTPRWRVGST